LGAYNSGVMIEENIIYFTPNETPLRALENEGRKSQIYLGNFDQCALENSKNTFLD